MRTKVAAAVVMMASTVALAAPASADTPGCVAQPWWYGSAMRQTTRIICDGPIQVDGSWMRGRRFYAPAYYVPYSCSWSRYGGSCGGDYWVGVFDTGVDVYPVRPDTVLPDEPGWIAH
jgi:hypothetical protein